MRRGATADCLSGFGDGKAGRPLSPGHSLHDDGRLVVWDHEPYRLTGREAAVVRVLWHAYLAGDGPWDGGRLLAAAGVRQSAMSHVFKRRDGKPSPAWGRLVVRYGHGRYGLPGLEGGAA